MRVRGVKKGKGCLKNSTTQPTPVPQLKQIYSCKQQRSAAAQQVGHSYHWCQAHLPVPVSALTSTDVSVWADLYIAVVRCFQSDLFCAMSRRLFPAGIPFSNKPTIEQKTCVKASPRSALDVKAGTENKPPDSSYCKEVKVEQPSTCGRFSYTTNPFLVNPRPVPPIPTVEMRPVAPLRKTIRDIRLRPRQTLCSKCKSAIHENLKGSNSLPSQKHDSSVSKTSTNLPPDKKSLKLKSNVVPPADSGPYDTQRKRRGSNQTPMVLLEDIKLKYLKPSEKKGSKVSSTSIKQHRNDTNADKTSTYKNGSRDTHKSDQQRPVAAKTRNIRSSSLNNAITSSVQNGNVHNWLQEIRNASGTDLSVIQANKHLKKDKNAATTSDKNSKPSPAIKISIGDGAILKIPPRLPTEEAKFNEQQTWPQVSDLNDCSDTQNQFQHKKSKKAAKKAKEKEKMRTALSIEQSEIHNSESANAPSLKIPKKHKKKHRHKHDESVHNVHGENNFHSVAMAGQSNELQRETHVSQESDSIMSTTFNHSPFDSKCSMEQSRPRLLYTWKQNQGLSRVASSPQQSSTNMPPSPYLYKSSPVLPLLVSNSPHRRKNASPARVISASPNWHIANTQNVVLKDYPLRSKSISGHSSSGLSSENLTTCEHGVNQVSDDSQSHSSGLDSNISDFCDGEFEEAINSEEEFFFREESPGLDRDDQGEEEEDNIKPLMMKIQTQNVDGCVLKEGREVRVGDVVWGKIPGFPWWPGRISSITVTQRDNDVVITQLAKVCWFGSNTMSHVHCADLYPFLQEFKARYNKKKKGQYRVAIKQATIAAQMLTDAREDDFSFEGYE
ncbi:pWWP domain-containing protein 2A [Elysia marginata]|uniref:PWWP domain-containing protein 2A n=1 Tax=Elysia marginata TaxID=1093978 RepID=A0AAV4IIL0_9GAST|nr:pWWP domain-containing protein 2A [Elysia marginata]